MFAKVTSSRGISKFLYISKFSYILHQIPPTFLNILRRPKLNIRNSAVYNSNHGLCEKSEGSRMQNSSPTSNHGSQWGRYPSINSTAKYFNIAESTLRGRINGSKSQREGDAQRQHLTESEEKALVKWIQRISITRYPPRYSTVKDIAEEIRKRCINSVNDASIQRVEYPELGQQWVRRFLNHHPHLR